MTPQEEKSGRELYNILGGMTLLLSVLVLAFLLVGRPFWVDGISMEPTLPDGGLILVRTLAGPPRQGDIVVLRKTSFREDSVVKRVIAVGGQTVEIDYAAGTVSVDGTVLEESYLNEVMVRQPYQTIARLTVPEGDIFVMGDNRNRSDDSRDPDCGTVDVRLVLGRAVVVMLPPDKLGLIP